MRLCTKFFFRAAAVALCLMNGLPGGSGQAADGDEPLTCRARNIIRTKLPAGTELLGLEYTVFVYDDSTGKEVPVDPEEHVFAIGDSFRVRIMPQDDVFVYVFTEGPEPEGKRACLVPERPDSLVRVKRGEPVYLPAGGDVFTFEPPAGEEKLVVVATKHENRNLALLATQALDEERSGRLKSTVEGIEASPKSRMRGSSRRVAEYIEAPGDDDLTKAQIAIPPDSESGCTEVVSTGASEMLINIPLRSKHQEQ